MFNRQHFNRDGFNRSSGSTGNTGIAILSLSTNKIKTLRLVSISTSGKMSLGNSMIATNLIYGKPNNVRMGMENNSTFIRNYYIQPEVGTIEMFTEASSLLEGEVKIHLKDIVLKPNDELVINTCDMTVEINGQNFAKLVEDDSDFFEFLPGNNMIVYSDQSPNRNIILDILWKDRWL